MALAGCGRREPDSRLLRADSLMWSRPDSALALIDSIDESTLRGNDDRALRALLLTQARHKNNIFETDDSLIQTAVKYYDDHGPDSCIMLAHFYRAVVLNNAKNNHDALIEALQTYEFARVVGNDYWLARVYELMGDMYYDCYNMETYQRYARLAFDGFRKSGHELNAFYTFIQMAAAIDFDGKHNEAIQMLDSIDVLSLNDSIATGCFYECYIRPLTSLGRYEEAIAKHRVGYSYFGKDNDNLVDWADIAEVYLNLSLIDSVLYCYDKIDLSKVYPENESDKNRLSYLICKFKGDYKNALTFLERNKSQSIDIRRTALKQNLAFVECDYMESKAEQEKFHAARLRSWLFVSIVFFLVVFSFFVVIHRMKMRQKMKELECRLNDVESAKIEVGRLSKIVETHNLELNQQRNLTDTLFKKNFSEFDQLASAFYERDDSTVSQMIMTKRIEQVMNELRGPEKITEIRDLVNQCCDGILTKYCVQFSKTKEADVDLVALICAGFSSKSVCFFLEMKPMTFYKKRSRIIAKIEELDDTDKNFYLRYIRK